MVQTLQVEKRQKKARLTCQKDQTHDVGGCRSWQNEAVAITVLFSLPPSNV